MNIRAAIFVIGLSALLGGCMDIDLSGDEDASASVSPNGCTPQGCPQAPQFCQARGYAPGTEAFQRCLVSVEQNLRKAQ